LVEPATIYLSIITLGEVMEGIALKQRADRRAAAALTVWLEQLRLDHSDRILPISDRVSARMGTLGCRAPTWHGRWVDRRDGNGSQQNHRYPQCR
jgi:toxin FitB